MKKIMKSKTVHFLCMTAAVASTLLISTSSSAAVVRLTEAGFTPAAGLITFSEQALGTVNPVYTPASYGGGAGAPTVTFGGYFNGQSLGTVGTCPAGSAVTGCVVGSPTSVLTLAPNSPTTSIVSDGANPTSPVLSGSPTFNGPISILFDTDLVGVGLTGGFFNAIGGTAITAFDRAGNLLGSVTNASLGIEFLGLGNDNGIANIAGLQFSLVGAEPAGFAIDNLRFGRAGEIVTGEVPEPTTAALLGLGLFGFAASRRKSAKSKKA